MDQSQLLLEIWNIIKDSLKEELKAKSAINLIDIFEEEGWDEHADVPEIFQAAFKDEEYLYECLVQSIGLSDTTTLEETIKMFKEEIECFQTIFNFEISSSLYVNLEEQFLKEFSK